MAVRSLIISLCSLYTVLQCSKSRAETYDDGYKAGFGAGIGVGAGVLAALAVVVVILWVAWMRRLPCKGTPEAQTGTMSVTSVDEPNTDSRPAETAGATGPYYELRQTDIGLKSPYAQARNTETAGATGPFYELRQNEIGLTSAFVQASITETAGVTGPYDELRQNEIDLASPYDELHPYEEPVARTSTQQN